MDNFGSTHRAALKLRDRRLDDLPKAQSGCKGLAVPNFDDWVRYSEANSLRQPTANHFDWGNSADDTPGR